jgi:hypothetical protein
MSYRITKKFCWYEEDEERFPRIVQIYFLNGVPFTFDDLPDGHLYDQDIVGEANSNRLFMVEDIYIGSFYLIDEQAHPCLFTLNIENPEDMPIDEYYSSKEEDLLN